MLISQINKLQAAAERLSLTDRGRKTVARLLEFLGKEGSVLDHPEQASVLYLLQSAWSYPGTVRNIMRDALEVK